MRNSAAHNLPYRGIWEIEERIYALTTSLKKKEKQYNMKEKHDLNTYSKLELAAIFYLEESFRYIHIALSNEYASIIFTKVIENIDPNEEDWKIVEELNLPEDAIGLLQSEIPDALTPETLEKLSIAWENSLKLSSQGNYKFGQKHKVDSIEILGHINNYGFFIETIINRHLLFLKQSMLIDDFSYARISIAKVMERMIYIFKDKLSAGTIHLNEITNLFSLRNKTVHYTPDNAIVLKPSLSELIQIWNQSVKILRIIEQREKFNEDKFSSVLEKHIENVKTRWI